MTFVFYRDLNITALGDIISILKHAKGATAKKAADEVLLSDMDIKSEKAGKPSEKSKTSDKPKPEYKSIAKIPITKEGVVMIAATIITGLVNKCISLRFKTILTCTFLANGYCCSTIYERT